MCKKANFREISIQKKQPGNITLVKSPTNCAVSAAAFTTFSKIGPTPAKMQFSRRFSFFDF